MVAVLLFREAQWPSHRAPSLATQLIIMVAVFLSIPAQSQSSTPKCIPIKLPILPLILKAAVSSSWVAQWPSHRAPSVGTQLHMAAVSMFRVAQ